MMEGMVCHFLSDAQKTEERKRSVCKGNFNKTRMRPGAEEDITLTKKECHRIRL